MKKAKATVALVVFLSSAVGTLTYGQDKGLSADYVPPTLSTRAFINTPVLPLLKKGDSGNLIMGSGRSTFWDDRVHDYVIGGQTVKYPVLGIVPCSDSDSDGSFLVVASTTVITQDVRPGEVLHSGGYLIEAKRAIKAGEAIPTLQLMRHGTYSIISMEAVSERQDKEKDDAAKPQPWLTIFDEHARPTNRTLALEAWRITNDLRATWEMLFRLKNPPAPSPRR